MTPFVCLMYHNVCPAGQLADGGPFASLSPSIRSYSVTTEQFAKQLRAIATNRKIDAARALLPAGSSATSNALSAGRRSREAGDEGTAASPWLAPEDLRRASNPNSVQAITSPRVLLTFDDGWAGSIDEAGPILAEVAAKAFLFVTTGLIGHPLFASEGMLRDLPTDQYEIGAHSVTHPFLAECSDDAIRRELIDSRHRLEDILGRTVDTMSVPNGSMDRRVKQAAHEAGYAFLFTSDAVVNDNAAVTGEVGRVAVRRDTTVDAVQTWCRGELSAAGWRRRALELPKRWLGPQRYRQLRGWALGESSVDDEMSDLVARHQRSASNHHQLAHTA